MSNEMTENKRHNQRTKSERESKRDLALHELDEAAERERWAVGLAHEEPLQDHGVEVTLRPPDEEAVQL
jgi:hypothetical protein